MGIVISKGALDPGDPRLHRTSIVVGTGLLSFAGKTQQANAEDAAKGESVETNKAKKKSTAPALATDDATESAAPAQATNSKKQKPQSKKNNRKTTRPPSEGASGTSSTGSIKS